MFSIFKNAFAPSAPDYDPPLHVVRMVSSSDDMPAKRGIVQPKWIQQGKRAMFADSISQYEQLLSAPHVLIAGATGCGKSTMLNGILYHALNTRTPAQAELKLIDPKRVELIDYKKTPFCTAYTCDTDETVDLLRQCSNEIEQRYRDMARKGQKLTDSRDVYIVIDELADLLISERRMAILRELQHILQIGRAARYHVIACTQAPSRRILPAELTLNFTDRIALRCVSAIESRQVIMTKGAEAISRYGIGLYLRAGELTKLKIPQIPEDDLRKIIEYWKD